MKTKLLLALLIFYAIAEAQIGIGNNVTSISNSEVLKIQSSTKGVLLPNVNIPNLNQAAPVVSPANSLIVYNTNTNTGKGFYFWKNNQWNPMLNTTNVYKYLRIVRSESVISTSAVTNNSPIGGVTYVIGESPNAHNWQLIPGLSKTISMYSPENNISITGGGISQLNSNAGSLSFVTYSIGLFIDSKLAGVRNFFVYGTAACLYNDFNVFFNISNLATGNHLVELRQTMRVRNPDVLTITFGSKNSSCTNLNAAMDKSIMNIQISEK